MAKQRKLIYEKSYKGHPINTDAERGLACDKRILDALKRTIDTGLEQSSKALVVRYDVRFPNGMEIDDTTNQAFRAFQSTFCKRLSRQGLKPKYVAVREHDTSTNPHYHVALVLDGQKTKSAYKHLEHAEATLAYQLGLEQDKNHGLIHSCRESKDGQPQTNTYMLSRSSNEEYDKAFHRLSYLAKVATKPADGVRELFVSKRSKKSEKQERQ